MDLQSRIIDPQAAQYTFLVAQKVAYAILIVGALGWLVVGAFDRNMVTDLFGEGLVSRMVFLLVGAAGLFFILRRDYYLPFLGMAVMPCAILQDRVPSGATRSITIGVDPGAKVLYWAAEPAAEELRHISDWRVAYGKFENVGVATADSTGKALLRVREPQPYSVPFRGKLEPHVHYRVCADGGMIGRVNTVYVPLKSASSVPFAAEAAGAGAAAAIQTEGFVGSIMEGEKAKRLIQTMSQAVPQINQVLSNLQTQLVSDVQLGGAEASAEKEGVATAPAPAALEEAFRGSQSVF